MPHKLCKISAKSAQRFVRHSRKVRGGSHRPPPPARARVKGRIDWFSTKHVDWTWLLNCYLGCGFWEFWNLGKNNHQNLCFEKFSKKIFEFSINRNTFKRKHFSMNMCTKFLVDIFKNGRVLPFWMPKKATFTLFTRISAFFLFSTFFPIWAVLKVF